MTGRERVLDFLRGGDVDHLPAMPITMQFAADHIGVPYKDYATDYRVLTEGQMRVAEDYGWDYVNTMSDPACEAADLGAAVRYYPDQPPALDESNSLLKDKATLLSLKIPDPGTAPRMSNRLKALSLYRERVGGDKLIEGWVEGPCAEGADLRGINTLMTDFFDDPGFVSDLFDFVVDLELEFAKAQVAAGAEQIGIGDAAASLVGPALYNEFVWPYEKRLVQGLQALGVPVRLHICGNTRRLLEGIGRLGCEIVELDTQAPVDEGRERFGPDTVIIGNMDPVRVLRAGPPEKIYETLAECHRLAGPAFIVGAGCEVPRDTPPENLRALVQYAKDHNRTPPADH